MTIEDINRLQTSLPLLHAQFVKLVGINYQWTTQKRFYWERWAVKFTEADLRLVVSDGKAYNATAKVGFKRTLDFNNLIEDTDKFGNRLEEIKSRQRETIAVKRAPKATERTRALADVGMVEGEPNDARSAMQILKTDQFFKEVRQTIEKATTL